jgi:hypothetical protein
MGFKKGAIMGSANEDVSGIFAHIIVTKKAERIGFLAVGGGIVSKYFLAEQERPIKELPGTVRKMRKTGERGVAKRKGGHCRPYGSF